VGERAREATPRERKKSTARFCFGEEGGEIWRRRNGGEVSRLVWEEKWYRIGRNEGLRREKV
jgi:hypothetical protein